MSNRTGISSETASARVTLAASIITFRKQWRRTRNRSERSAAFAGVTRMTHVFRAAKLSRCPRRGGCISIFTGRRCDRVRYNASPSPPISEIFPADCVCVCVCDGIRSAENFVRFAVFDTTSFSFHQYCVSYTLCRHFGRGIANEIIRRPANASNCRNEAAGTN